MPLQCVDLYAGAGGLSLGLLEAGIEVRVAIEIDPDCEETYQRNIDGPRFIRDSVDRVSPRLIKRQLSRRCEVLVAGGPPCQLFSRLSRSPASQSAGVRAYVKMVTALDPDYVVFENVPAILNRRVAWKFVVGSLKKLGYYVSFGVLRATMYGVPQLRERLIVLAARTPIELPSGHYASYPTVRDAIGHFPDVSDEISNHKTLRLSEANLLRIRSLGEGENSRASNRGYADSYARMSWDRPAPTLTTKCISFSNGRFGHPVFDRALTVREAATLQGFPEWFTFVGSLWSCARQVGNAVPPPLARSVGRHLLSVSGGSRCKARKKRSA